MQEMQLLLLLLHDCHETLQIPHLAGFASARQHPASKDHSVPPLVECILALGSKLLLVQVLPDTTIHTVEHLKGCMKCKTVHQDVVPEIGEDC